MKKLGIAIGVLLALFVAIALIVPLMVDVDKYRPQIVEAANKQINGKLELGKLSLSLWGQVRIEIGGLKLLDSTGNEVVGVKDAYFHLPFWPLLTGSPVLTFKMKQPLVSVIKNRAGKLNVMTLVKEAPKSAGGNTAGVPSAQTTPPATPSTPDAGGMPALPGIVTRARIGVELQSALITYKDEATGLNTQVKDLNFILRDISLSHPTELEIFANLDTQLGKTFKLQGPARWIGKAQPTLVDGKVDHVSLTSEIDMDEVEMSAPGMFEKKKGIPTRVEFAMTASEKEAKIEKFIAKFFNVEINAQGTVTHLTSTTTVPAVPVISLNVKSNEIEFKPWVELIPLLKEFDLGGSAKLEADLNGPSQKLGYHAKFTVNNFTAKAPKLKAQPKIDAVINVVTDQIDTILITMKAPANDLKIQGKVVSFLQPRADFVVTSTGMDLDQLIEFPPPAPKGKKTAGKPGEEAEGTSNSETGKAASTSKAPAQDFDAMLAPLRENKILGGVVANLAVRMKMIKAYNVKVSDIDCKFSFKDLTAGIDQCGLNVFSGNIKSDAHFQLRPKTPTYQLNTQVAGLDLTQAVESQMALFKNTVTGKANFSMKAQGASFNPDPAISNLKANGTLKVDQAAFATIDVAKMVSEALNKSLGQLGDKIPGAKGKSVSSLPNGGSKYEFISSDFTIAGAKFSAPNFVAKALPNQGIDLKGTTTVGMKDYSLNSFWDVIDTYNLTHAKDISVDQGGVKVDHVLAEGNSPVHFPMHVDCTIMAPCYSYTEVPAFLAKIAMDNVGKAVSGRAKEEIKKRAESLIKQAPPQIQDKLKGLFH